MDRAADLVAEDVIDEPVLLEPREAGEGLGDYGGAEVVAAAGEVVDLGPGVGDGGLYASFEVFRGGHLANRVATWIGVQVLATLVEA